jgi:hypothetical protein
LQSLQIFKFFVCFIHWVFWGCFCVCVLNEAIVPLCLLFYVLYFVIALFELIIIKYIILLCFLMPLLKLGHILYSGNWSSWNLGSYEVLGNYSVITCLPFTDLTYCSHWFQMPLLAYPKFLNCLILVHLYPSFPILSLSLSLSPPPLSLYVYIYIERERERYWGLNPRPSPWASRFLWKGFSR